MRLLTTLCVLMLTILPLSGRAGDNPVVIELFTSQGCSSCPPADELLKEIGQRDGVIALALHVDYWDYLGWKDEFAHPSFTSRQKSYAHAGRRRTVFTPEMVVQGVESVVGHKRDYIVEAIASHQQRPQLAKISIERTGDVLTIIIAPTGSRAPSADLLLVRYLPDAEVMIERGENAGKAVYYTHIVGSISRLTTWDGQSETTIKVEQVPGPIAVLAQETNNGPILSAARLD